mgnify:CR=1 FL=1
MRADIDLKRVDDFNRFMVERHNIFIRKELSNLPYPWSSDPILTEYSFCNVYKRAPVMGVPLVATPIDGHYELLP